MALMENPEGQKIQKIKQQNMILVTLLMPATKSLNAELLALGAPREYSSS